MCSCQPKSGYPETRSFPENRYFDYSGDDGCSPANIGHRLGGDVKGLGDNTLTGMLSIVEKQSSPCFKHWEFDLMPSKNNLILRHDILFRFQRVSKLNKDQLPPQTATLAEFVEAFNKLPISKPLMIDLKAVHRDSDLLLIKEAAHSIQDTHQLDVWFITDHLNALRMKNACRIMQGDFDIMLYFKGGKLCRSS